MRVLRSSACSDRRVPGLEELSREELIGLTRRLIVQVEELTRANAELTDRVARLERLVSRNSRNSGTPPSKDDDLGRTPPADRRRGRGGGRRTGRLRLVLPGTRQGGGPPVSAVGAAPRRGVQRPGRRRTGRCSGGRVRQPIDALVGAHLLEQSGPGRYQLHDLLRAYAIDQVRNLESDADRQLAQRRILDWYLHTADAALARTLPFYRTVPLDPPTDIVPLAFATSVEADAWFEVERENLVAATRAAAAADQRIAWRFAALLRSVFIHQNAFESWFATARIGLAAARALHHRRGEAEALESLGKAHFQLRQLAESGEHHRAALAIRRETHDEYGTAVSINALGLLGLRHRRLTDSLSHFRESLAIFERLGNERMRALLLSNLGETYYELGQLDRTAELLNQAITVQRQLNDRGQEGNSLFFLSMT
jgi:tetratricopeptide (TPR) repeat protein